MIYPPSPALSACDSLDGIDDLDAFLAARGALSHWPTPPLKTRSLLDSFDLVPHTSHSPPLPHPLVCEDPIANAFAREAAIDVEPSAQDADTIHHILLRADLPLQVLAVAFNILSALRIDPRGLADYPPDLLTVAALSLIVSYTDDHAPLPSWYSRHVCQRAYSPQRINSTASELWAALDWHLHKFTSTEAIQRAMFAFCSSTVIEADPISHYTRGGPAGPEPLELVTSHTSSTRFEHGICTPDGAPPCSALRETPTRTCFLQLL